MRSALMTAAALAVVGLGYWACARDLASQAGTDPVLAERPAAAPDVAAQPKERPDVLVVEIEAADVASLPSQPQAEAGETPESAQAAPVPEAPAYRTAASGPERALAPAPPSPPASRRYTVRPGDWLVQIARDQYGSAAQAGAILEANRDRIADPDHLVPGQELILP